MIFSTNSVIQFHEVSGATVTKKDTKDGIQFQIVKGGKLRDVTDDIQRIEYISVKKAADDKLCRKSLVVALASGLSPVKGQEYVLTLEFRNIFGQEDSYQKSVGVLAKSTTAADLYEAIAQQLLLSQGVEVSAWYEIYDLSGNLLALDGDKNVIIAASGNAPTLTSGFKIVEAVPYHKLGSFPKTLMDVTIGTAPIWSDGIQITSWLNSYAFEPDASYPVANSATVADLELFAKGEKGLVNAIANWPDNIIGEKDLEVDYTDATGYDMVIAHYSHVGAHTSVQKAERDVVFAAKAGEQALETILAALVAYSGLTPIEGGDSSSS